MHQIPCLCAYASSATAGLFDFGRLLLVFIPGAFYTATSTHAGEKWFRRRAAALRWSSIHGVGSSPRPRRAVRLSALSRPAGKLNARERDGGGILGLI